MAKYSFELKKKMVEEYFECKGGYGYLEKKYNINYSQIRKWIKVYEKFGDEGPKLIEYIFNVGFLEMWIIDIDIEKSIFISIFFIK